MSLSSLSSVTALSLLLFLLLPSPLSSLNSDGTLLLSFKYSITSDPLSAFSDWNYSDESPCSWNGVMCMGFPLSNATTNSNTTNSNTTTSIFSFSNSAIPTVSRVISLVLPNSQLVGSLSPDLGLIEHLRHLDLSGNSINGTLPSTLFNASELRVLSLSDNEISGEIPAPVTGKLGNLQLVNLSENALVGELPAGFTLLPNLTLLSLANNYLFGELPGGGFDSLEVLDLSSNLINGSIPGNFGGKSLKFLNLSYNRLAGPIPPELGVRFPVNATIDLSYNNLTGQIPQAGSFLNQKPTAFAGNGDLCGKPLVQQPCTIPSTLSNPPNGTEGSPESKSPPAIAVMPKDTNGDAPGPRSGDSEKQGRLRPAAILAIAAGDVVGIAILFLVFMYVYQIKKKKRQQQEKQEKEKDSKNGGIGLKIVKRGVTEENPTQSTKLKGLSCCVRSKNGDGDETEETSDSSVSSEGEEEELAKREKEEINGKSPVQGATLVTVDGDTELEMETLLKASAYILGAAGSSIVYKAVLSDGTALAVRRIGESSCIERFKDFEIQVRLIAKFRHPNLLRLRGFYWGTDEKLLIHDYATNGSLANISFNKKLGSSPLHLSWDLRLKIARGVARGLSFLHDKKCVHGNTKPSNILLNPDFEPLIGDFGLDRLMTSGFKPGSSARQFGSKRSMHSTSSLPDLSQIPNSSPVGSCSTSAMGATPPYHAPESLKILKPNAKWDVYSFGMVLLELVAGRVLSEVELCQWNNNGFVSEERSRVLRLADPAIRGEIEGREEVLLSCFKLGFGCCAVMPQKRPHMKEVVQVLERLCLSSSSPLNC